MMSRQDFLHMFGYHFETTCSFRVRPKRSTCCPPSRPSAPTLCPPSRPPAAYLTPATPIGCCPVSFPFLCLVYPLDLDIIDSRRPLCLRLSNAFGMLSNIKPIVRGSTLLIRLSALTGLHAGQTKTVSIPALCLSTSSLTASSCPSRLDFH